MRKTLVCLIMAISLPSVASDSEVIKKTNSGLCHDSNSGHYQRTKNYKSFESMSQCIESGGRAYKGYNSNNTVDSDDYDRKLYPHWKDLDSDCQDARTETLISQSVSPVTFKTAKDCKAIKGTWNDPYSGKRYYNAIDLDIDHIVSLGFAHEHGGREMSPEMKKQFANDPINLLAVDKYLNRSKGAKSPMEWLPPNEAYQCQYMNRFKRIMITYKLKFTPEENREFEALKRKVCN